MTWFKVDDSFYDHPKVERLEEEFSPTVYAEAIALWTMAGSYCARHLTNGEIRMATLRKLVPFNPKRGASALVSVGIWHQADKVYEYHDWSKYQPTREKVERERERTRNRVQRHRNGEQDKQSNSGGNGACNGVTPTACNDAPARPGPARPEGGDPPSPPPARKRDPMALSRDREDVQRVFARWRATFGFERASLTKGRSADADILADAIDEHGEQACLDVLGVAPADGMVSGKQDDKGRKHESIRYIFGNADTLHRLLRAVDERAGRSARQRSAADLYREYTSR